MRGSARLAPLLLLCATAHADMWRPNTEVKDWRLWETDTTHRLELQCQVAMEASLHFEDPSAYILLTMQTSDEGPLQIRQGGFRVALKDGSEHVLEIDSPSELITLKSKDRRLVRLDISEGINLRDEDFLELRISFASSKRNEPCNASLRIERDTKVLRTRTDGTPRRTIFGGLYVPFFLGNVGSTAPFPFFVMSLDFGFGGSLYGFLHRNHGLYFDSDVCFYSVGRDGRYDPDAPGINKYLASAGYAGRVQISRAAWFSLDLGPAAALYYYSPGANTPGGFHSIVFSMRHRLGFDFHLNADQFGRSKTPATIGFAWIGETASDGVIGIYSARGTTMGFTVNAKFPMN